MLWYTVSQCILPLIVSELALLCSKSQLWNQRNIKKISVVFDEGLQKIGYNELEDLVEIAKILFAFAETKFTESKNG